MMPLFLYIVQEDRTLNTSFNFKAVVEESKAIRFFLAGYISKFRSVHVGGKVSLPLHAS